MAVVALPPPPLVSLPYFLCAPCYQLHDFLTALFRNVLTMLWDSCLSLELILSTDPRTGPDVRTLDA